VAVCCCSAVCADVEPSIATFAELQAVRGSILTQSVNQ
jgi:hypothetical protein